MASALINITDLTSAGPLAGLPNAGHVNMDMSKAQGGANPATVALFKETSQNPILLDTIGFITSQWWVPSLPQLPPSSTVLRALWPRLQKYAGLGSKSDPLFASCTAGAAGDEAKAKACMEGWGERVPAVLAHLGTLKAELNRRFPVTEPGHGSYSH